MKKFVAGASEDQMLRAFPLRSKTDGWFIRMDEVANDCWRAEAADCFGRVVAKYNGDGDVNRLLQLIEELIFTLSEDISHT